MQWHADDLATSRGRQSSGMVVPRYKDNRYRNTHKAIYSSTHLGGCHDVCPQTLLSGFWDQAEAMDEKIIKAEHSKHFTKNSHMKKRNLFPLDP